MSKPSGCSSVRHRTDPHGTGGYVARLSPDFGHGRFSLPGELFAGFSFWLIDARQCVDGLFLRGGPDERGRIAAAPENVVNAIYQTTMQFVTALFDLTPDPGNPTRGG